MRSLPLPHNRTKYEKLYLFASCAEWSSASRSKILHNISNTEIVEGKKAEEETLQEFALNVACLEGRRNQSNPHGHSQYKYISLCESMRGAERMIAVSRKRREKKSNGNRKVFQNRHYSEWIKRNMNRWKVPDRHRCEWVQKSQNTWAMVILARRS